MKQNAKEYLLEFASSQNDWLKALIYEAIETNGEIGGNKKNEIFKSLQDSSSIEIHIPNIGDSNNDSAIHITKLIHKKGANALVAGQTIKFNNDITILYGMNGAGKSGYFKILNEIVGGNHKKDVLPNIYLEAASEIDVEIKFQEASHNHTINWDGNTRSLSLLNKSKVFDTSYLNGLLDTRRTDETLIQPLGLNLFTYLVEIIDEFKNQLLSNADKKKLEKPNIDLKFFSEQNQDVFQNHTPTKTVKKDMEKLFDFSDENAENLKSLKKEIEILKQVNIQDKVKLYKNNKRDIENLKNNLQQKNKILSSLFPQCQSLITDYKGKVKANLKAKEQFEALKLIPNNDTEEWKEFIIAGNNYSKKIDDSEDICPYCRQSLEDENSITIVKSYGSFLKDNSEQELSRSIESIETKKKEVEGLSLEINLTENISLFLKDTKINNETLYNTVDEISKNYCSTKKQIIDLLDEKNFDNKISISNIIEIVTVIDSKISELQLRIEKFSKEDSEKQEKIRELEKQLKLQLENESISTQQSEIKKWFEINDEENAIRKKANSLKTRQLSTLSKSAHNELLTDSLKQKFNEELVNIGYPNLDVNIENAGIRKGASSTKLVLTKNNAIKDVLSEGEQKAVALALFIAEIRLQSAANPIILDDPVNSLDHKIAGKFAERLLQMDNQVILFNHNRLFLDAFESSKPNHVCKTTDTDCPKEKGKHIKVYEVISQGKNLKGILRNYKGNFAKYHIREAKSLLNAVPFREEIKVANLLRITVECTVDEIVFNHQVPTRFSNKNSRIHWGELKKINKDNSVIDTLERIHSRLSGGEMHNGTERNENPLDVDEFNRMLLDIDEILNQCQ